MIWQEHQFRFKFDMTAWIKRLENWSKPSLLATGLGLVAVVGVVDYFSGYIIFFSAFYLIPVALTAWFVGRGLGYAISVLSVAVWLVGDFAAGARYPSLLVPIWKGVIALIVYLVVAKALASLRKSHQELEERVRQRTSALTEEITERERLERELLEISEREQRRIGQDLHDSLCQHLTGATLAGQVLEEKLAALNLPLAADAGNIVDLVEEGIDLSRKLAKGLYPVEMAADGLMLALEEYAAATGGLFKVACRFECDSPVLIHDPATAGHLYRIAQEAVGNAIKHGKARNILIRLEVGEESTVLSIKDDGAGLPEILPKNRGLGLRIMAHRTAMIGGVFNARRDAAGGTLVACELRADANPKKTPP